MRLHVFHTLDFYCVLAKASEVQPKRYTPLPEQDRIVHSEKGGYLINVLALVFLMSENISVPLTIDH
jgi:hypothetical protein